jgi:hypothetical protein
MSATRPLLWKFAKHSDSKPAASSASNSWLNTFYANGPDIEAGQTVIRTRLQIDLVFGWQSVVLTGGDIEQPFYQDNTNIVGLYAKPTLSTTSAPPSPALSLSDGYWVQNDALTVHRVSYSTNYLGQAAAEVHYKADSGTNESFGKRGPYTVDVGSVFLAWNFSTFAAYWDSDDTEFSGWMGGTARWAVLVESAP